MSAIGASTSPDPNVVAEQKQVMRPIGETSAGVGSQAPLRSSFTPFAELAPRQKVMGVINAIAVLRSKVALLEEMKTAFEPRTSPQPAKIQPGSSLPGPALAYGDCRLGILPFEVCRHLGFLEGDPMVAPSSTQSKLLRLVGASSLVDSFKKGQVNLHDDPHLSSTLGPQLLHYAIRALGAFWNCQLLLPAFDTRAASPEQTKEALYYADAFLFQAAMQAKSIIRFSRSEYNDLASWLALLFSDAEPNASAHRETEPQPAQELAAVVSREKIMQAEEAVDEVSTRERKSGSTAEDVQTRSAQSLDEAPLHRKEDGAQEDGGIFGGFLSRLFPSPSQKPAQSYPVPQAQQTLQPKRVELDASPITSFSALANSVGEGLSSIVANTARSAAKLVQGEASPEGPKDLVTDEVTEKRVGDILNSLPEKVNGQF